MDKATQEIEEHLNDAAQELSGSGFIVANPKTIKELKARGLKFESKFISYEEYIEKLFLDRKKVAREMMGRFPLLSANLANASVKALYEEIRECYAFGILGASITLAVILLELALKDRLFRERQKHNPNYKWDEIEKINFQATIKGLRTLQIISKDEERYLNDFNLSVRNPYIHYNLKKLVENVITSELVNVKTTTAEKQILKDVRIKDYPYLWFAGKKFLDKEQANRTLNFTIGWVNQILTEKND